MANYIRTQIMLGKKQHDQLDEIAQNTGVSFSQLVREFLDAQMRIRLYEDMQRAAEQLKDDYTQDADLTSMIALDGEDLLNV